MQASASDKVKLRFRIALVLISIVFSVPSLQTQTVPPRQSIATPDQSQAAGAQVPQPLYTLSVKSQLVTLDVVVNDKNGEPVRGLTRDDFTIYEDKVAQPIVSFEATEPRPVSNRPPGSNPFHRGTRPLGAGCAGEHRRSR